MCAMRAGLGVCRGRGSVAGRTISAELEIMRRMNGSVAWRAALVLRLRALPVLAEAAVAGVPLAAGIFAAWCAWLAADRERVAVA
jgi:hypothetical protein